MFLALSIVFGVLLYLAIGFIGTGLWFKLHPKFCLRDDEKLDGGGLLLGTCFWPFALVIILFGVLPYSLLKGKVTRFINWANACETKRKDIRA